MQVTLGGDRLGSGNKNKIALRNYERSTHNLSQRFTSSMQCGVLYPFLVEPAMRGDTFEIDLAADGRTIPTKGPLFGSFKMQVDLFQCPWRLYQAILHNNPTAIGLKMNQVFLPQLYVPSGKGTYELSKMNNTCLLKYLGLSGTGIRKTGTGENLEHRRKIMAIPVLAYYDIFKTYYANKQEENAYVIGCKEVANHTTLRRTWLNGNQIRTPYIEDISTFNDFDIVTLNITFGEDITGKNVAIFQVGNDGDTTQISKNVYIEDIIKFNNEYKTTLSGIEVTHNENKVRLHATAMDYKKLVQLIGGDWINQDASYDYMYFDILAEVPKYAINNQLVPFNLKNIDDMRLAILSKNNLGTAFRIGKNISGGLNEFEWNETSGTDQTGLPYSQLINYYNGLPANTYPLNGLLVKTYQSDLFNNWVNTEWIDGENGIAAVTAISTSDGSFTIDSLNLAEKLYNMLNRIAVADGTYEGWQDAVYTESPRRHIESPVYLGGMSSEIVFEEIVQTSPADGDPLGTLGGKGKILKRKGGHVTVKIDEASFIIGIVSLTPRINYTQGNAWYLTDLLTMDDLHKPALDGIGFENLIGERLAWFDTKQNSFNSGGAVTRSTIGKVPAWINYMTAVDKGYGDFAEPNGNGFMLLQREYERTEDNEIKDATTYIDPRKYNYAFAYSEIDAQNFWVQIQSNIKARRLMSAKQIPNI